MSQEKVEAVRRLYEAFARRELDVFFDSIDPEFELRTPALYPEAGEVFRGRIGLERWLAMIAETWAEWSFEPERFIDLDPDVLVLARILAEGRSSGVRLDRKVAHRWSFMQGRPSAVDVHLDPTEALEAAGVRE